MYRGGKPIYKKIFVKVDQLPENIKLIVVDEGGMIPETMGNDILSFGLPVLVLGDKHQLPPVMGRPIFLTKPDAFLTEIMRQQKDSPIIYLSQLAMYGIEIPYGTYGECRVIRKHELTDEDLASSEMIICGVYFYKYFFVNRLAPSIQLISFFVFIMDYFQSINNTMNSTSIYSA